MGKECFTLAAASKFGIILVHSVAFLCDCPFLFCAETPTQLP